MFQGINLFAVIALVISSWLLGGIWYSKYIFGSIWCTDENRKSMGGRHPAVVFTVAFVLWTITSVAFVSAIGPNPPFWYPIIVGFLTGTCFVATSFGVNYVFAGRSFKLFMIDAVYHILQFTLYGVILGSWQSIFG